MWIAECGICKDSRGRSKLFTNVIHRREEGVMKEKSKGLKESKKAPQLSLKEKRKLKKEKKNR